MDSFCPCCTVQAHKTCMGWDLSNSLQAKKIVSLRRMVHGSNNTDGFATKAVHAGQTPGSLSLSFSVSLFLSLSLSLSLFLSLYFCSSCYNLNSLLLFFSSSLLLFPSFPLSDPSEPSRVYVCNHKCNLQSITKTKLVHFVKILSLERSFLRFLSPQLSCNRLQVFIRSVSFLSSSSLFSQISTRLILMSIRASTIQGPATQQETLSKLRSLPWKAENTVCIWIWYPSHDL
jgi:hypothetical protein